MTTDQEQIIASIDDLKQDVGRMHGTVATLATLVAQHLQCHGMKIEESATTSMRPAESSSVSLHVPGGSLALREMRPAVLFAFVLVAALAIGGGWALGHNLHPAQAATETSK